MPIVTIQSPQGESFKIDAPEWATDEQILRFARSQGLFDGPQLRPEQAATPVDQDFIPTEENLAIQPQQKDELSLVDKIVGGLEALATFGTGATTGSAGFAIGSLEGALGELSGDLTPEQALEVAQKYGGSVTYQPKTEAGQKFVKDISEKLGVLPPVLGSTPVTSITSAIPTPRKLAISANVTKDNIGEFLTPVGKVKTVSDKGMLSNFRLPKDNGLKRKLLSEQTLAENPNIAAVTKILQEDGSIVTRPNSKRALKVLSSDLGDEAATATVSVVENMSRGSKKDFLDMLDLIQKGRDEPLFGQTNRPSDILGRAIANRARDVNKINQQASKQIGNIAKNELGKTDIDISNIKQSFYDSMAEIGVNLVRSDDGKLSFDFSQSRFVGGNKELINRLNTFLESDRINGFDAHKLKQFARELVDFGEGTESAISQQSQAPIKALAANINDVLVNINKNYGKANKKFADTIDIVNGFNRLVKNVDLEGDLANQSLANKARRLVSNAESRAAIRELFDGADEVLKANGIRYKNNIDALNFAVTKLEDSFKITPPDSIRGNLQRAGVNIAQGMGPTTAATAAATEGLMSKVFGLTKPDFDKKMKAYRMIAAQEQ